MSRVEAIVSDFGGVLTSPLFDSFAAFQDSSGISLGALGKAMAAVAQRDGANPLFELETGRMSEAAFLASLGEELTNQLGRPVELHGFGERYFEHLHPNEAMIALMRGLRERGYKLATAPTTSESGSRCGAPSSRSTRSSTRSSTRRSSAAANPTR